MKPLISIIVPVYKVEKYLPECLDSVTAQTYSNLEVILVDDGSPDSCGQICDRYAQQNQNFVVIHQENQGLSCARNHGVEKSKGDLIYFLDSDDFISSDCIEYLYSLKQKYCADIAVAKSLYYWDDLKVFPENRPSDDICYNKTEALIEMCYGKRFAVSSCNILIDRQIVLKHPFPAGKLYEEVATTYRFYAEAKTIAHGMGVTYYYRMREGSIVHGKISEAQLYGLQASEDMLTYVIQNYPDVREAAEFRCFAKICDFVPKSYNDKKTFKMLREKAKKYSNAVMKSERVKTAMKLRYIALRAGRLPAKVVFSIINNLQRKKRRKNFGGQNNYARRK